LDDLINTQRRKDPYLPASLAALGGLMTAQGSMMTGQGVPPALLALAMMNAGIAVALQGMSREKVGLRPSKQV
jgi:hypothetical protein